MTLDRYMPCPGGTGKKIKFCCEDLLGELEAIQRMLEGDQRLACLESIETALEKYPDRACLLAIKALLHSEMQQEEALEKTLALFESKHPDNPVMLAERAIQLASHGRTLDAVLALQGALASVEEQMPTRVYEAIGMIGRALLGEGNILAAKAHLLLQAAIGGTDDPRAMSLLTPLIRSADIPLILRDEQLLVAPPKDALYKEACDVASDLATRGNWLGAAEQFDQLAQEHKEAAGVWRNLAVLRSWLGQSSESVLAWRTYEALDSVTGDDAVEAEAIAQLIDPNVEVTTVAQVLLTFDLEDIEVLAAQMAASSSTESLPVDRVESLGEEDQPPPRAIYLLLDRDMPKTGDGIQLADIPRALGQCYLFGRQTDRAARLEFVFFRDEQAEAAMGQFQKLAGSPLGDANSERVVNEIPAAEHRMSWNWRLPPDTPAADRERLVAEQQQDAIFNIWPTAPNPALGGKTPQEAAGEKELQVPLLASILVLEMSAGVAPAAIDFNQLRTQLDLPCPGPLDPADVDIDVLPLVRMARVDVQKMTDKQLVTAYRRSAMLAVATANAKLAPEVIARESLDGKVDKAEAYGILANQASCSEEALTFLSRAREIATANKESPARWLLAEFDIHLRQGNSTEAQRLLQEIQSGHLREPGIAQAVYEILARYGIIDPRAAGAMPGASAGGMPAQTPAASAEAESGGSSDQKIWTPDSTGDTSQKKSAIWTPDD